MDHIVKYTEANHEYTIDGAVVPSVTQILGVIGWFDWGMIDGDTLETAQKRGTYVHDACCMVDKGTLDESTLDKTLKPYVEAYRLFLKQIKPVVIDFEQIVYSVKYQYAGRYDRYLSIFGEDCLLDIKSGVCEDIVGVQLAGYDLARVEMGHKKARRKFGLQLKADGSYSLIEYKANNYERVFLAALEVYKYKARKTNRKAW